MYLITNARGEFHFLSFASNNAFKGVLLQSLANVASNAVSRVWALISQMFSNER